MLTYVLRRLLGVIPVVLLVTLIVFTMNANIPGDPGRIRLGQRADPAQVEAFNFKRGYLDPFLVQYVRYLGFAPSRIYADHATFDEVAGEETAREAQALLSRDGVTLSELEGFAEAHDLGVTEFRGRGLLYASRFRGVLQGDLGESDVKAGKRVGELLGTSFLVTVRLALGSILIAMLLGVGAGILSAVRSRTWIDYSSMVLAIIGVSMPVFWLGILMIMFVAPPLGLPRSGLDDSSLLQTIRHLALPCTALGLISSATIARLTRSAMLDVLSQDFVRTAKAKGLRPRVVILRHALRNASIPIVTVVGNSFGYLLVGAVLTESVFALNGLGSQIVESIVQRDKMVITGGILIMSLIFVSVNLLVDLSYGLFDPRVRHGRG
ncbi:MAG: ABC transporter permease [Planctomycetota bacterium]|jgi:peptide/nickel transport system permease protein